jgi:hypothetical protein
MTFDIRDHEYIDNTPYVPTGAAWFDGEILDFRRGSTVCGSTAFRDYPDGKPSSMLCITTAPRRAWAIGDTDPWDTCIFFSDQAGAKEALRVARWLLRGDPRAPLMIDSDICLHVGATHAKLPCWRALAKAAPGLFPWRQEQLSLIGEEVLPPILNAAAEQSHNRVIATVDTPRPWSETAAEIRRTVLGLNEE